MATLSGTATFNGNFGSLLAASDAITGDILNINTIILTNTGAVVQTVLQDDNGINIFDIQTPATQTTSYQFPGSGLRTEGVTASTLAAAVDVFIIFN